MTADTIAEYLSIEKFVGEKGRTFLLFYETFNRRNILTEKIIKPRKHLTDELFTIVCRDFRQFLGQLRNKT